MASAPKTLEGLRTALRQLGDDVRVCLNVYLYEHREPGSIYVSEGLEVKVTEKEPGRLYRKIKADLVVLRKRMREQKRIAHQPKLLEYRERA